MSFNSVTPISILINVIEQIEVLWQEEKIIASSGNRTRAARVAGEHSTTEPTMLQIVVYRQQSQ